MAGAEALARFMASSDIDDEQWHEGLGSDLRALGQVRNAERAEIGASSAFDWELRPLFLHFGTPDEQERAAATAALGKLCGVNPAEYLEA